MNFDFLKHGDTFSSFFDYHGEKIPFSVQNTGYDTDFEEDAFVVTCNNKPLSIPYMLDDLPGVIENLPIVFETQNEHEERKIISFRIPISVLQSLKTIAKKDGLSYQTLMNSVLHQYVEGRK